MAQQTQLSRVIPAYEAFLGKFPNLRTLARASLGDVLRAWAGLGYNRRALALHTLAKTTPKGLPRDVEALLDLPGVGPYTAAAVATFAFDAAVPFADTNIRRVLGRVALGRTATLAEAITLDAQYLAPRRSSDWHAALMDLGATVCIARTPRCSLCPLATVCIGRDKTEQPQAKQQTNFATSDRRVRGAIVRALRDAPNGLTPIMLQRMVDDPRVRTLTTQLIDEGLIERYGSRLRLPV